MKSLKILTTIVLLILSETLCWRPKYSLNKDKVVYALNCGSNQRFQAKDGFIYEAVKIFFKKIRIDITGKESWLHTLTIQKFHIQDLDIQEIKNSTKQRDTTIKVILSTTFQSTPTETMSLFSNSQK